MENPHAERHAALLGRIIKNVDKCNEVLLELNQCAKEINEANVIVARAADLYARYRKNVLYNLEATGIHSEAK